MRATQSVSPIYGDAMQMAASGYEPAMIAERCGIARAEGRTGCRVGQKPGAVRKTMAETPQTPQDDDEAGELRSKLAKRLAFAGVLVALLLGTLTFFDYLSSPQDDSDAQIFTEPVPVAPRKEVSQPVKATDSLPEPPAAPEPEPVVEAPPPPPVVAPAPAPVPATEAKVDKVPDVATEKRPAATSTAAPARPPVKSSASQSPSVQPAPVTISRPARPVVEEATYAPVVASPTPPSVAAPTLPSARVTEIRRSSPQVVPPSSIARLFSGFSLQAGVFRQYPAGRRVACQADLEWSAINAGNAGSGWPLPLASGGRGRSGEAPRTGRRNRTARP